MLVRLRSLVWRNDVECELDEELRYHIDQETERLIASGMSANDARLAARRSFGNVGYLKEESRDARSVRVVDNIARDLSYAARLARRQPIFAAVVVLSLSLGLGAATAVFNLTYNVLFARLAVPRPAELSMLRRTSGDDRDVNFSREELRAIHAIPNLGTFAAIRGASQIAVQLDRTREYVNMQFVDGGFFPMLGITAARGRLLTPNDDEEQLPVAVLSAAFAERLAPGDSMLVGKTILIREAPFTVVGITPPAYRGIDFPGPFTVVIPLSTVPQLDRVSRRADDHGLPMSADPSGRLRSFRIVGRLTLDRSAAAAAILNTLNQCCARGPTATNRIDILDISRGYTSPKDEFRGEIGSVLMILLAGMGLLVVVICCNVASLLVVRSSARAREIAVRLSLGASRARLVSQLVIETLPLALLGGIGGVVMAAWATSLLVHNIPEWGTYFDVVAFRPRLSILLFTGTATLLSALGFAVYPALRATRGGLAESLRLDSRLSRTKGQGMVARGVVVAQVAFAVVLVTAASLMAITLRNLRHVDGGFTVDGILLVSIETRGTSYEQRGSAPIHQHILDAIRAVSGVREVAGTTLMPMYGGAVGYLAANVPGYVPRGNEEPSALYIGTTPGYFAAAGIPIRSGRDFGIEESANGAPTMIVSRAFVKRYFAGVDPIGRSMRIRLNGDSVPMVRVVGVAEDAKYFDLRSGFEPVAYLPFVQTRERWSGLQFTIRTKLDPASLAPAVTRAIEAAAPGVRVGRVSDMHARVDLAVSVQRLAAQLASFAGAMVLALCAVGLYGVVSYSVARRTSELGVRMALGAGARAIMWLVVRETANVVGVGVMLGLALSFAANSVMSSQLFGVGAHDPLVMAFAVALFTAVALLACAVPARRAARIDPCIALSAD
jgi:predicted permease